MKETTFHLRDHLLFALLTVLTLILCIGVGSVSVPFRDTAEIIFRAIAGGEQPSGSAVAIILYTRLPRVLCGLLRNPLADGSTLGVSSGASLGAALAILSGVSIPFLPFGGTAGAAMLSAFLSLVVLLALAFALDHSLATNTLILLGVVFSMFVSALLSLLTLQSALIDRFGTAQGSFRLMMTRLTGSAVYASVLIIAVWMLRRPLTISANGIEEELTAP